MKARFKHILLALAIVVTTSSCLEEKLSDTVLADAFSVSEDDIVLQMNGMYADLAAFNCFKNAILLPLIMASDNFSGTAGDGATVSQKLFTPQTGWLIGTWNTFYRVINGVNTLLPRLEQAHIEDGVRDKIKGNLYFLRGFSYFYLVRMYGGVPVRTEPVTSQSDFYLVRNSVKEVYELLLDDLQKAYPLLPLYSELPPGEFGNATRGAAQAILSLACLTYGNHNALAGNTAGAMQYYTQARDFADSVILSNEYTLLPDYADLWDIEKETEAYNEVIFGIPYTRDAGASLAASLGSEIGTWTRGNGQWRVQPWFYDECSTGDYENDYRTEVTFLTTYINENNGRVTITYPKTRTEREPTVSQPFLAKYIDPAPEDTRNRENDFPIIRLAEVFLIKAEAENEINGPSAAGIEAFNQLRARARKANGIARTTPGNITMAGLTKESFRQKIFRERGFELLGEGQRWFDLVRMQSPWGTTMYEYQYSEVLPGFVQGLPVYNVREKKWSDGRVAPNTAVPYDEKFLLYPIPTSEIGINPNMKQNYGW